MLFLAVYFLPNIFEPLLWSSETNGVGFQSWADLFYQISACLSVGSMKDEQETVTEKSDSSFFGLIKIRLTSRSDLYDHRHTGRVKYFIRQKYFSYKDH